MITNTIYENNYEKKIKIKLKGNYEYLIEIFQADVDFLGLFYEKFLIRKGLQSKKVNR